MLLLAKQLKINKNNPHFKDKTEWSQSMQQSDLSKQEPHCLKKKQKHKS
jgi:hypothetical protein